MSRRSRRSSERLQPLEELASRHGVAVRYTDAFDTERRVGDEALVGVLAALGVEISEPAGAVGLLARDAAGPSGGDLLPPVVVAWDGAMRRVTVARSSAERPPEPTLVLEDGSDASDLLVVGQAAGHDGAVVVSARRALPFGLHHLHLAGAGDVQPAAGGSAPTTSLVISAPTLAPLLRPRSWGAFAPTYALRDRRRRPAGDLTCLEQAAALVGRLGGSYLVTLPLLADYSAVEVPGRPVSPYSPISRMWWNEAYLDPTRVPEIAAAVDDAATPVGRPDEPAQADLAGAGARLRPLLGAAAARLELEGGRRLAALRAFEADRPEVRSYACFRAAAEQAGTDPAGWPPAWRQGDILSGRDVPQEAVEAHVYAQWVTDEQIAAVAATSHDAGCELVLDLPIGCRPGGYDPWAFPGSFAGGASGGVSVGAPPDHFFVRGQDWGFPPLHPEAERRAGYPVLRRSLAHLFRHAGALRIDHAMALRRLWWIPEGRQATEGAYVHYPSDELLALACLEAWRRSSAIVAEDLGTVEPEVHDLLAAHGIAGTDVAVFDLEAAPGRRLGPRPGAAAFVDTHDTATFAGWYEGSDLELRQRLGMLGPSEAAAEARRRGEATSGLAERLAASGAVAAGERSDPAVVHAAVLEELGRSDAGLVVAALEDLWGEHDPQNVPGTTSEQHANFTRFLAVQIDDLAGDDRLLAPLRRLAASRAVAGPPLVTGRVR